MNLWRALFGSKARQPAAPAVPQLESIPAEAEKEAPAQVRARIAELESDDTFGLSKIFESVDTQVKEKVLQWEADLSEPGKLTTHTSLTVGKGIFGLVSLTGEITPQAGKYTCKVRAVFLPLANDVTEEANSLEEAKDQVVRMFTLQTTALLVMFIGLEEAKKASSAGTEYSGTG